MQTSDRLEPTPQLARVEERLESLRDLPRRGIDRAARRVYPIAAVVVGCLPSELPAEAIEVAAALELIDEAVVAHYYDTWASADERLLAGDYGYALGMRIVADMARPELVAILARATADVAKGHSLPLDVSVDEVLLLCSALWPAAVGIATTLVGADARPNVLGVARAMGRAREMRLAELDGGECAPIDLESDLGEPDHESAFGSQRAYLAAAIRLGPDDC